MKSIRKSLILLSLIGIGCSIGTIVIVFLVTSSILWGAIAALVVAGVLSVVGALALAKPYEKSISQLDELANGGQTGGTSHANATLEESILRLTQQSQKVIDDSCGALDAIAKGNLALQPLPSFPGVYARLSGSIQGAFRFLNSCVCEIAQANSATNVYTLQIDSTSQELAASSKEQAMAIGTLSMSMSLVAERAIHSTKLARKVETSGDSVKELAIVGTQQMDSMMQAVQDISDAGKSIEQVIKLIDDIAFQTNILALNAAVEAARAGVHGKGFAVVADEVRTLAGRSAKAAKDTTKLILNTIQKSDEGRALSLETQKSLEQIMDGIQNVTDSIIEISSGSDLQAKELREVKSLLERHASAVAAGTMASEQTIECVEHLQSYSQEMSQQINAFRLDAPYQAKARENIALVAAAQKPVKLLQEDSGKNLYTKLIWNANLEMGDATIDGQHQQLIEMVDGLLASCFNGNGKDEINASMQYLLEYTQKHFADEERLQVRCGYPDRERHKAIHDAFKIKAVGLAKELDKQGPTNEIIGVINKELVDWLINHIKGEDKKISQYLRK